MQRFLQPRSLCRTSRRHEPGAAGASRRGLFAEYLLKKHRPRKAGVLYQNDDYGKGYLKGLKDGLHGKMQIIAEVP
jgi:hypothetical protein